MLKVWVSDKGVYQIPERFCDLQFTKSGWFDLRRRAGYYAEFKEWLQEKMNG